MPRHRHISDPFRREGGFTIIELLVVIVVIAILASISIVSYTGVQNRARATKAKVNASAVQRTAQAYQAEHGVYPTTTAMFDSALVRLPTGVTLLTGSTSLSRTNGENSVLYKTTAGAAGACVMFWDFESGSSGAVSAPLFLGNATSATCSTSAGTQLAS